MEGTRAYLELARLAAVGPLLLDPRPAFVVGGDGARVLWANVSGAAFFGAAEIPALLGHDLSASNPARAQIARLSRLLPSDHPTLEMLRFGFGVRLATLTAACQRLNLPGDERAVLIVGAAAAATGSLRARAEHLTGALANDDGAVAVIDDDGTPLATSTGFGQAERSGIAPLIEAARTREAVVEHTVELGGGTRPGAAIRFPADGHTCVLVLLGPAEVARTTAPSEPGPAPPPTAPPRDIAPAGEPSAPFAAKPPPPPPAPSQVAPWAPLAPTVHFTWATDSEGRFTFVSPELGDVVGAGNAAVVGKTWPTVAEALALDPAGAVTAALARGAPWSATVHWPLETSDAAVAVDLAATPIPGGGYHGFGTYRSDDRREDLRRDRVTLAAIETAPPPHPPEPSANGDLDDAARASIEGGISETPPEAAPSEAQPPSNGVPLPGTDRSVAEAPETLTGSEADAFRQIREVLAPETQAKGKRKRARARHEPSATSDYDTRLLDRLPIGVAIFRDRQTLFASRPLVDLLGHESLAAFVAAGGIEAAFPGGADDWTETAGERSDGDVELVRADGVRIVVEARLNAVTWVGATALMLSVMPRRPSPEPKSESETLAAAERRIGDLEAILDTATDGVIVVDREARIVSINHAAEALFGIDAHEWRARRLTDLLAEESHRAALDYLDGLASNGVASVLNDGREVIGKVPHGGLIPLFMTMGRIDESDRFCAVLSDITHWKNAEEELIAARRAAETANAQKSEFLAKISHEIRTPLNAIIGFSEIMMGERFGPIGNDRYRSYLNDIHISGEHLKSLINDLLDLSKIEAGKFDLQFEAVPLNGLIQECVALMQPLANRERIIIRTSLGADIPNVVADPRSLRQILLNLMSNAVKFTRPGGQVIVSTDDRGVRAR